jgi:hypothetical protein
MDSLHHLLTHGKTLLIMKETGVHYFTFSAAIFVLQMTWSIHEFLLNLACSANHLKNEFNVGFILKITKYNEQYS